MPGTKPAAKPDAPALPSLDSIASVKLDDLPASTKAAALNDDESALARRIIEAGSDGGAAVGPKLADRAAATSSASRIRRLVNRYITAQGTPASERPSIATRIVPKDGGVAWAITIVPATVAAEAETPTEGNAITEAAASA